MRACCYLVFGSELFMNCSRSPRADLPTCLPASSADVRPVTPEVASSTQPFTPYKSNNFRTVDWVGRNPVDGWGCIRGAASNGYRRRPPTPESLSSSDSAAASCRQVRRDPDNLGRQMSVLRDCRGQVLLKRLPRGDCRMRHSNPQDAAQIETMTLLIVLLGAPGSHARELPVLG